MMCCKVISWFQWYFEINLHVCHQSTESTDGSCTFATVSIQVNSLKMVKMFFFYWNIGNPKQTHYHSSKCQRTCLIAHFTVETYANNITIPVKLLKLKTNC